MKHRTSSSISQLTLHLCLFLDTALAQNVQQPQPLSNFTSNSNNQNNSIRQHNSNPQAYPMQNIDCPGPHDVVLGRGRGASSHTGNVNFRAFIKKYKPTYAAANRIDKPKVAGQVVAKWREMNPPGRFLVQVRTTNRNVWNDVGDRKARQKTSQSLRERDCARWPRRRRRKNLPEVSGGSSSSAESNASYDEGEDDEMDEDGYDDDYSSEQVNSSSGSNCATRQSGGSSGMKQQVEAKRPHQQETSVAARVSSDSSGGATSNAPIAKSGKT